MDIDSYIAKYGPEWDRLEAACVGGRRALARKTGPELEEILTLYLRVSGHLAEVQTRYHDEGVRTYLNSVVVRAHAALYGARTPTARSAIRFFGSRYRAAIRSTVPFIGVAAGILFVGIAATTLWVATSTEARLGLLPPAAREAVRHAGGEGSALGLAPEVLSLAILLNNVQVAILSFAFGVTFAVGTVLVLARNALFIGALAGAFHAAGRSGAFWALVLPHGFLELTAIAIAAGAGLRMGWSMIDPGDRSRVAALGTEAREAVLVVVGVVPAFALAALIEGFLTPSGVPAAVKIAVGAIVAAAYIVFLVAPVPQRVRAARGP